MAELPESVLNTAALRRVDPYVENILETAAHVALYTFNQSPNEWEKTEIEGALFVYSRTGEPYHNIIIMNRLNINNLVEPVTQGLDLQLQDPFLLYRNTQGQIYGIWFYDKEECIKIASTLDRLVRETMQRKNTETRPIKNGCNNGVDLFSMLSKAQEEYNSKSPKKSQDILQDKTKFKVRQDTPQSVMDFFAKASGKTGSQFIKESPPVQPGLFVSRPAPPGMAPTSSRPIPIPQPQSDVKPLLQRLMSNPVHSVEHIEKQQRSVTPQSELAVLMRNKSSIESSSKNNTGKRVRPLSQDNSSSVKQPANSLDKLENGIGFLSIADSSPTPIVETQQFFNSALNLQHSPKASADLTLEFNSVSQVPLSGVHSGSLDTTTTLPALMPPVMFTSSASKDEASLRSQTPTTPVVSSTNNEVKPEPLNRNQLVQAMNYLIMNDKDFVKKLHEAYLKSFGDAFR